MTPSLAPGYSSAAARVAALPMTAAVPEPVADVLPLTEHGAEPDALIDAVARVARHRRAGRCR